MYREHAKADEAKSILFPEFGFFSTFPAGSRDGSIEHVQMDFAQHIQTNNGSCT